MSLVSNTAKKKANSGKGGSSSGSNLQNNRPSSGSSSTGKGNGGTSGGNVSSTRPSSGSSSGSSSSSGKGSSSSGGNYSSGFTRPVSENRPSSGSSSIGKGGGSSSSGSSSSGSSSSSSSGKGSSSSIGKGSSSGSGNLLGNAFGTSNNQNEESTDLVEENFTSFYPSSGAPSSNNSQPNNNAAYEQYLAEMERMEQERKAEQQRLEEEEQRKLEAAQEAERQKIKAQTDAAVSQIEGQRPGIRQYAEEAARQAYINKMLTQRDLPQQLAATGSSGGLTDSAVLALNSNYENSHNSILENQNAALNELDSRIAQVKANQNFSLADAESQYQQQLAQQLAAERAKRQDFQNQMDLLAYQAQLDSQYSQGRSGGSNSAGKPRLTYSQLQERYDNGDTSADIIDGLNYYRPGYLAGSEASGRLSSIKQYIDATAGVAGGMGISNQAMAQSTIEQAVRNRKLSAAEARQLAAMYGVTLEGI